MDNETPVELVDKLQQLQDALQLTGTDSLVTLDALFRASWNVSKNYELVTLIKRLSAEYETNNLSL
jgi:hypothetical protein